MFPNGCLRRIGYILDNVTKLNMLTKINYVTAILGGILIIGLMFYNAYATCARYIFNAPPQGSTEISTLVIPVLTFLALAYTLEQERHIVVDVVINHLSIRNRLRLGIIANILIAIFGAILFWKGGELSLGKFHEVSSSDVMIPLFPFYIFMPIGGLLLFLQSIKNIRNHVLSLATKTYTSASIDQTTSLVAQQPERGDGVSRGSRV